MNQLLGKLEESNIQLSARLCKYEGSHLLEKHAAVMQNEHSVNLATASETWAVAIKSSTIANNPLATDLKMRFTLMEGTSKSSSLELSLTFVNWSKNVYLNMPAAVYAGNRFSSIKLPYYDAVSVLYAHKDGNPPLKLGPDMDALISDVPRLNIHEGLSRIQLSTRDMSTPAVGVFNPADNTGFWLLTEQNTTLGDSGITFEENADRTSAVLSVTAPCVREDTYYQMCDNEAPSPDQGTDFTCGDTVELHARLYLFTCSSVPGLLDVFMSIRKDFWSGSKPVKVLPFSSAYRLVEEKYNRDNWSPEQGFYSAGVDGYPKMELGWCSSTIDTYGLLNDGQRQTCERARKTLAYFLEGELGKAGFLLTFGSGRGWTGDEGWESDGYPVAGRQRRILIRRNGDGLYYIIKQLILLERLLPDFSIPEGYSDVVHKCADALVVLWEKQGQFGQYVDPDTGDIIAGGTVSGGIIPAALVLAHEFFGDAAYLRTAEASAQYYYDYYVSKGYTNGGPGDMIQCPDSESAYGILESFVTLYEATKATKWLEMAKAMAAQFSTWCVSYDFSFPPHSTFGKMGMKTTGTVFANVQNKHSAPGICTHSGAVLFRLYRATGDMRYLELIRDIANSLMQFVSRDDRPVRGMDGRPLSSGWMSERVQMSDWEAYCPTGEICFGSMWPEVSVLLTYAEIPGIYVQPDTGSVCVLDNVRAEVMEQKGERLTLKITNPTPFDADIKIFVESSTDRTMKMDINPLIGCRTERVGAGETRSIVI